MKKIKSSRIKKYRQMKLNRIFKELNHNSAGYDRVKSTVVYFYKYLGDTAVYTAKPKIKFGYRCEIGSIESERNLQRLISKGIMA